MPDLHGTRQTAFRIPEGLLARLKATAGERQVTAYVITAIEEKLARDRITSAEPSTVSVSPSPKRTRKPRTDSAPPVVLREPRSRKCDHRVPVGAYCRTCDKIKEK